MLRSHLKKRDPQRVHSHANSAGYLPGDIRQAYGLPRNFTGKGQKIGIVELGGAFSQKDFDAFRQKLGLPPKTVACVYVAGGQQQDDPGGANVEVMMDAEIATGLAPDAEIALYFCPNVGTGIASGISQAVADGCDVISISWGAPEDQWSASDRQATDAALQKAVAEGVSVFVAAGDNGSGDGESGDHADYPASSPYAVGCGGTRLLGGVETVWNDGPGQGATGGGMSAYYDRPTWQYETASGQKRGVPDVAGVADPETGWIVLADGQWQVVGGTSAVAPMWAAIAACMQEAKGARLGYFNPIAYANPQAFRDILSGQNGTYQALPGYDECTGLGSPNGPALFALVTQPPPVASPPPPPPVPDPTPVSGGSLMYYLAVLDADGKVLFEVPIDLSKLLGQFLPHEAKPRTAGLSAVAVLKLIAEYGPLVLEAVQKMLEARRAA